MRDILVTLLVFGSLPYILSRPYIGIYVWSWLSYMNPHRLGWGFAYNMPFAQIVAIVTLISIFMSKEKKRFPITSLTIIWFVFLLWMAVTTFAAVYPEAAMEQFIKVLKIQFVTILTMLLINDREKLIGLIWVIVMSIGFFGVKGGIFTLLTGGSFRVWGPPGSFIEDNNELALALLMIVPLIYFLFQQYEKKWVKYGLLAAVLLCLVSVIGSYSRGAFLATGAMMVFLFRNSKKKALVASIVVLLVPLMILFMPKKWDERMSTIKTYDQDRSALGRINAWHFSINVANARPSGGGFNIWTPQAFEAWAPDPDDIHVAHSIYFSVLGEHGWIGLILFLAILWLAWRNARWVVLFSREHEGYVWAMQLASMIQVSLIAYMVGGAFLSLSYFDLPWHLIAITVVLRDYLTREQEADVAVSLEKEPEMNGSREKRPKPSIGGPAPRW